MLQRRRRCRPLHCSALQHRHRQLLQWLAGHRLPLPLLLLLLLLLCMGPCLCCCQQTVYKVELTRQPPQQRLACKQSQ